MRLTARIFVSALVLVPLFLLILLVPLLSSDVRAAENLLNNPGFEDGTAGWATSASTVTFEATSSATKSGNYSGLVTKKSSKSWGYIFQEVEATPSAEYRFSGWVYFNDLAVRYVKLRIDWLGGGGESLKKISEVKLESRNSEFQKMTLNATAPEGTVKAKVEAFINLDSPDPQYPVLFDDLKFKVVEPLSISFTLLSGATAGEGFDVPITVRNADPSGVYYAKAIIGESTESAALRKGYTYNSVLDKWLAWNGSWSKMPTFVTDADGSASFTLKSKVKDDTGSGTYYYLVRIRKVGTDDNLDSEAKTFSVAASEGSNPAASTTLKVEITPMVDGDSLKVNQSFDVKIDIKSAKPLHDYYVKVRLGLSESKLTKGRTYNGFYKTWLSDSTAWSKFPIVYTTSDGTESVTISAKVASGSPAGTYHIEARIRDKETEKNYDSELQTIVVGLPEADSEEDKNSENPEAVLGATTELPATGGGVTNLPAFGRFATVWLPVLVWMLLIFIGSSIPGVSVSESRTIDFLAHKLVHLLEYSVLFILVNRAVKRSVKNVSKWTTAVGRLEILASFGLTVGYAVTDEIHQFFVRGRDARAQDVLIDAVAAFLGWLIICLKKDKLDLTR